MSYILIITAIMFVWLIYEFVKAPLGYEDKSAKCGNTKHSLRCAVKGGISTGFRRHNFRLPRSPTRVKNDSRFN